MKTAPPGLKHLSIIALAILFCSPNEADPDTLYGTIDPPGYLMGDFEPSTHRSFVNVNELGIQTMGRTVYLRRETAAALKQMIDAFHRDHPSTRLWIVSGTRNFAAQKSIWEGKWNGSRKVDGEQLNRTEPDPERRALRILQWSSMPGTSRHHWGTDFDINLLQNDYYRRGPGKEVYDWLSAHASEYGFCQPYTAGRDAGYNEERWHWSYVPLSRIYLNDWNDLVGNNYPVGKAFQGSDVATGLAPIYVNTINDNCK